jgi:hypothetical protein
MEYHNFQLVNFYKAEAVDYQKVLDDVMAIADIPAKVALSNRSPTRKPRRATLSS